MKNQLKWAKEHKKECLIAGGGIAATTIFAMLGIKHHFKITQSVGEAVDKILDFGIDTRYGLDCEEVPLKDLGNIGKNFLDAIPEATENTVANVIAWVEKKDLM